MIQVSRSHTLPVALGRLTAPAKKTGDRTLHGRPTRKLATGLLGFAVGALSWSALSLGAIANQAIALHRPQISTQAASNPAPSRSPLSTQAMYRELANLTGRVESTYLANHAQNQPTQLRVVDSTLTASANTAPTIPTPLPAELQAAQQLLNDWQGLISQGEYETAHQRFQTVTDSLRSAQVAQTQIAGRSAQPEVRSIWLDRETIVSAGSQEGLAKIFERFKAAGINTVFVETVNAGYPIYPSTVAPEQNPLISGWDPLQASVELGKAYGLEVHAWVWLFAAGNQAHNPLVGKQTNYPGPILTAHPDWAGFDNHGNLIIPGQTKPFLDPANPEVRQYLFNILSEIAGRYDVDGIQFDYVRYPFQDPANNRLFGYGNAARQQFHALTGVDPISLSPKNGGDHRKAFLWGQWTEFRTQQISSFVAEASQRLRHQKPGIKISAAVFADDTRKRQQTLQQDWEDWADQGLIDWIVLMSYASSTQRFDELIRPWVVESSYRHTQVIPGIRLLNLPAAIAHDQLQLLRDLPTNGYALFAADNLTGDVQAMLARTQGNAQSDVATSGSDTTSYTTASAQYKSLQQEWNWLLTNQQIQGDSQRLARWVSDVNQIGESLDDLGSEPSARELQQVTARLDGLGRSLPTSLSVNVASTPYRLRTWQNRLTAINRLLAHTQTSPVNS